jgi:hypothetical protein
MINYSIWKEKTVSITKLKVDFKNPRLSHIKLDVTQNELINEMVENYKAE